LDPKIPYKLTFILPLIVTKEPEMLQPDAFCDCGRAPPQTPLVGTDSALQDPIAGFKRGKWGKGKGGERERKG